MQAAKALIALAATGDVQKVKKYIRAGININISVQVSRIPGVYLNRVGLLLHLPFLVYCAHFNVKGF